MSLFINQFKREWLIQARQIRGLIHSFLFFLVVVFLFPLTIKPDFVLLRTIAPGLIWMALLLSFLLSAERLFQSDYEHGVLEQWLISGQPLSLIIGAKIMANWLFSILPIVLLCPLLALFFSFSLNHLAVLVLSIVCGTPALFFLCALTAAFGLSIHQKSALMAFILIPLTIPVLIFGSGVVNLALQGFPVNGHLALLCAFSLLAIAFLPFAIAGVIRIILSY